MPPRHSENLRPVNHVFVDFENVHEVDLTVIGNKSVTFTLLLGSRQTKLDVSLVEKLLEHVASVELVRLTSTGRNALDFTLAYYVGRAVSSDPTGYFHIVSGTLVTIRSSNIFGAEISGRTGTMISPRSLSPVSPS